ncbi:hypothetical protein JX265_008765 [Neoarthrinium moseri]|uniref:SCP domain-containing protein n=1 Tax=Neoarthrinium moseri TaxID=1658444 RepID=A0A9P9WHG2_9PEZI|nr:uncharacterized protein JN550_008759 [Neoarthrinium moseri]KAI1848453.1 hypothetical protein JX266_005759 [Neoarthrinium moseri]KAI1863548.1 hypothetical protein JX265_008765 [Neoarthrinium moseri]KAI1864472.1 hypothetical protein JN550_008759 [Neoarthrinium moseri]
MRYSFIAALFAATVLASPQPPLPTGGVTLIDPVSVNITVEKRQSLTLDQSTALKLHNDGRAQVGSPPVQALIWDTTLTAHAQSWANYLASIDQMQHSSGTGEGENLASQFSTSGVQYPLSVSSYAWMNEKSNYHGEVIPQGNFASYGHYTQCVWRGSTKVGIAYAISNSNTYYTVARYSPAGNVVGQTPY